MSCGRFSRVEMLDHLLSRSSGGSAEMDAHLRHCERCGRDVAALDRLTRVLDALRAQTELKPPDGFFAGVLQECRAVLPRVASERRPAIRTAAVHGVGTGLFVALRVEEKKRRILPLVAISVLVAATVGALAGALRAGLVTRALTFAEPGGWMRPEALGRELLEAGSKARLRALSGHLWRVVREEAYWPGVDVERLAAFDLARHIALREGPDAAALSAGLVARRDTRVPMKVGSEELSAARAWIEATSVGDARAARTMVEGRAVRAMAEGRESRLLSWLRASSELELGEEEKALRVFDGPPLAGFAPADCASVYLARKLGDEARAKTALSRLPEGVLKSALSRR